MVKKDGVPLAEAQVTFIKEDGGTDAVAETDADGHFRLEGARAEGTLPGSYKVVVSKLEPPKRIDPKNLAAMCRHEATAKDLVPEIYTDVTKTPIRCDIPRRGVVDMHIELKSTGP